MRKHCGNCANHREETNRFSEECGKCVAAVLENGERSDPSHWKAKPFDFLSTYIRMTKPKDNGECGISCSECPLSWKNNGSEQLLTCAMFIRRYPERAVELLRKWEEEHKE